MINTSHIKIFSNYLKLIMEKELEQGNKITETSKGWPKESSIIIFLEKPFFLNHTSGLVEYRELNDPHYWKAEYVDNELKHILACRF